MYAHVHLSTQAKQTVSDVNAFLEKFNQSQPPKIQEIKTTVPKNVLQFPKKQRDIYEEYVSFIEQHYQEHRSLPNQADFERKFDNRNLPQTLEEWKETLAEITPILQARGISPYETPSEYLEPNFVLAVSLICNPVDTRSRAAKLKEANLSTKTFNNLLLKPKYKDYYERAVNEIFDEHTKTAMKLAVMRGVENGDFQFIKHFNELQNIYRPNNSNEQIISILRAIMEILAVHVSQDVLIKIGAELRTNPVIESTLKELSPVQ